MPPTQSTAEWSKEVIEGLYEGVWREQPLRCPHDNALLTTSVNPQSGGAILIASCPRCGNRVQWPYERDASEFRRWADAEKTALADLHFSEGCRSAECPVENCGAQVEMTPAPQCVLLFCHRCGNEAQVH